MIRGPILQDSFAILAKEFYSIDPLSVSGGRGSPFQIGAQWNMQKDKSRKTKT